MIDTPNFTFIHLAKCGGTFVSHWLERLDGVPLEPKHGGVRHVPDADKPLVSSMRHPLDLYLSHFHYGYWRRSDALMIQRSAAEDFFKRSVHDFDFEQFMLTLHNFPGTIWRDAPSEVWQVADDLNLGWLTVLFALTFCRHPLAALEDPLLFRTEVSQVQFLRMEHLNQDLYDLLSAYGYHAKALLNSPRIYPSGGLRNERSWQDVYEPGLAKAVFDRDHRLFEVFPHYETRLAG